MQNMFPYTASRLQGNGQTVVPSLMQEPVSPGPLPGLGGEGMGFNPEGIGQPRPPGSLTDDELKDLYRRYKNAANLKNMQAMQGMTPDYSKMGMQSYSPMQVMDLGSLMSLARG